MRKRPWNYQAMSEGTKDAIERAMSHDMQASSQSGKATGCVNNEGKIKTWSDDLSEARPGQHIEDVERELMNHLTRTSHRAESQPGPLKSLLRGLRNHPEAQRAPKEVTPQEVLHATTSADTVTIDPITNRRVSKQHTGAQIRSMKNKVSDSTSFTPKFEDVDHHPNLQATPSPSRATLSSEPKDDTDNYQEEDSKKYEDLDKYRPERWNEPDGRRKPTSEEQSKDYEDLDKYKPEKWNEPNGRRKPTPKEESKKYDDLDKYRPEKWNEPDGLPKLTPEEESKKYDDLDKYSQTDIDDPNAPPKLTPEEKSKLYTDLGKYKAVAWNEPEGLRKVSPEEESKQYDDLHSYNAVRWNEPDGLRQLTPEELSKEYHDLAKYGPVLWNEPDGLRRLTPEELSKFYQDLGEYKPVQWNEPNGLRRLTPEEESKKYDDLQAYDGPRTAEESVINAHEASQMDATPKGKPLPPRVEVVHENPGKDYKDLRKYGPVYWNEPDGLRKLTPEELSKNYDDLHLYGAVRWNEPDGLRILTPEEKSKQYEDVEKYAAKDPTGPEVIPVRRHPEEASKDYDDLDSYGPVRWNEPDGLRKLTPEEESKKYPDLSQYTANNDAARSWRHPEEASKDYKDLDKYSPTQFDSPEQRYPIHQEATKQYEDLDSYAASSEQRPTGSTGGASGNGSSASGGGGGKKGNNEGSFESLTADEVRANVLRRARHHGPPRTLDEAKTQYRRHWDPIMKETHAIFGKDGINPASTPAIYDKSGVNGEEEARTNGGEAEASSMDESFPAETSRLEPALDRHARKRSSRMDATTRAQVDKDPYSKAPQGLETSYVEECGGIPTWPTVVKHYGRKTAKGTESTEASDRTSETNLTQSYKILAYDPSTDSVRSAETSSAVHDTSKPMTPGDIVLRLANPAKFFPHLSGLGAEGYEMISGHGDVLVFRKVRPASPDTPTDVADAGPARSPPVNPIDMMGKPVTGNFASPTGFVNYDTLPEEPCKPAPPFRSNIDVRREEPVFSGTVGSEGIAGTKDKKKKRGVGRKMVIGTAYVAGGAYALGVMAEYFATAGTAGGAQSNHGRKDQTPGR